MWRFVLALAFTLAFAPPASAAEPVYQKLSDANCETVYTDEISANLFCEGPEGTPFLVSDGDARVSVTFGGVAPKAQPPFQSFVSFNSVGETIEWWIEDGAAVATILRWHVEQGDSGKPDGQVLVVSKVGTGSSPGCPVAYVDALADPGANVLARDVATLIVPNVDCSSHVPFYYGRRGPSAGEPMLSPHE